MDDAPLEARSPRVSRVLAHGRLDLVPVDRPTDPEFALYLDERWRDDPVVTWAHTIVDWPDFGLPTDESALFASIADLHRRARAGALVEVACFGGIGRTGTVLSSLTAAAGVADPEDAVAWVRAQYHPSAVETADQEQLVARFAAVR